jgi:drug/metabolite transporter (DMT)-like permease
LATSLSFSRSLFMIVLAILFLDEVVRARRWSATLIGIVGIAVMLRPTVAIDPAAFYSLFSAFMVAAVMVATKKLSTTEPPVRIIFYAGFFGTLIAVGPAIVWWQTPTLTEFALLILLGVVGTLGTNCMVRALAAGEATVVAPVEYVRILFATMFGFFIFAEAPDIWTGVGAAIVVGSTLYITLREARLGKPKPDAAAEV